MLRLHDESLYISPRLFECSNQTGVFISTEIANFTQEDLDENDVMLLDIWDQVRPQQVLLNSVSGSFRSAIVPMKRVCSAALVFQVFLWIGRGANETEKKEAFIKAQDYLRNHPAGRNVNTPIVLVKQEFEPPTFTGWFPAWDPYMFRVSIHFPGTSRTKGHPSGGAFSVGSSRSSEWPASAEI